MIDQRKLQEYCARDVALTHELYRKLRLSRWRRMWYYIIYGPHWESK